MDLRRRPEGARRQGEQAGAVGVEAEHDRQGAVVAGSRDGDHPIGDLALEHHDGVGDPAGRPRERQDSQQDGGRQVVRQVADDAHGSVAGRQDLGVAELEEVAADDGQLRRRALGQRRGQIAVDFDGANDGTGAEQRPRQRAEAGTDLDERFAGDRRHGGDQLGRPRGLEEMLAEALAGPVPRRLGVFVRRRRHGVALTVAAIAVVQSSRASLARQYCSSMASISSSLRPK